MCLLFLKVVIKGGEHVLDYGIGTGILGIAALKMGDALRSAGENMLLNGMNSNKMRVDRLVSTFNLVLSCVVLSHPHSSFFLCYMFYLGANT